MRSKSFFILLYILAQLLSANAQEFTFSGTVVDPDGYYVSGATITNKRTFEQTQSQSYGKFKINAKLGDTIFIVKDTLKPIRTIVNSQNGGTYTLGIDYAYVDDIKNYLPYKELKNILETLKNPKQTNTFYLPDNDYLGKRKIFGNLWSGAILKNFSFGYHKTNFLNAVYGENINADRLNKSFGIYGSVNFKIYTVIPILLNYNIFISRYTYSYSESSKFSYLGWDFSMNFDLGMTRFKALKDVITSSYIGIGYQKARATEKKYIYEDPTDDLWSNQLFWTLSFNIRPMALFNNKNWYQGSELQQFFNKWTLNFTYEQSLNTSRPDAFNSISWGLNCNKNIYISDIDWKNLPGSNSDYAMYISDYIVGNIAILEEAYKTQKAFTDTTFSRSGGALISLSYSNYPLIFTLSYFKHQVNKNINQTSIPIIHRGIEFSTDYGISRNPDVFEPFVGIGYQLAGLTNREYLMDDPDDNVSGLVWRIGIAMQVAEDGVFGLNLIYQHSFFRSFIYNQLSLGIKYGIDFSFIKDYTDE